MRFSHLDQGFIWKTLTKLIFDSNKDMGRLCALLLQGNLEGLDIYIFKLWNMLWND